MFFFFLFIDEVSDLFDRIRDREVVICYEVLFMCIDKKWLLMIYILVFLNLF